MRWWSDLRMAVPVWSGVALVVFCVQVSVMVTALVMGSALRAASTLTARARDQAASVSEIVGAVGSILAIVTVVVVLVTVGTAVSSRRAQIALWLLLGATPGQVVRMVMTQVVFVTVVVSVPAAVSASALLTPALDLVARSGVGPADPLSGVVTAPPLVIACGISVLLAVLGAWRSATAAGRLSPVEALRAGRGAPSPVGALTVVRYGSAIIPLGLAMLLASTIVTPRDQGALVTTPLFVLLLTQVFFALVAPALLPKVVWIWTRLPLPSAAWVVARETSVSRSARLTGTITPLALCIALVVGALTVAGTLTSTVEMFTPVAGDGLTTRPEVASMILVFGLPTLVAGGGALGSMVIAARSRALDLALPRLVGASPSQTWWQAFFEGVILIVTALVIGTLCVSAALVTQTVGLVRWYGGVALEIPWVLLVVLGVILSLLGGTLTAATSRGARTRPPHRVIAELVGE